jgi:cytoskeletal protein CcmA (bactofilin family)
MAISSSGAITTTGVISGSDAANAISASYAQAATSASFASVATSASFASNATSASQAQNAVSSSFAANAANANLLDSKDSTEFAITGSNIFTGTQYVTSTINPNGFGASASIYTDGGLRVTKDTYVSGTMFVNNLTVFGTQSINYITSSQLNISTNIISVNTDTPSIRFGGLSVYDSGSTGLTGSMLWDSERDHWVYSNPSGSSYSGGMIMSGPRSSALGSEQGTLNNFVMKGQGGDHITSSQIIDDGTTVRIPGNLQVTGSTVITGALTASSATFTGSLNVSGSFIVTTTAPELQVGATGVTLGNALTDIHQVTGSLRVTGSGVSYFLGGNVGVGTTSLTATNGTNLEVANATVARVLVTQAGTRSFSISAESNAFYLYDQTANATRLYVSGSGNIGIGTTSPTVRLQVSGTIATGDDNNGWGRLSFDAATNATRLQSSKNGTDSVGLSFWTQASGGGFAERMAISGSNVGIGTSTPGARLELRTSGDEDHGLKVTYAVASNGRGLWINQPNSGGGAQSTQALIYINNSGNNPYITLDSLFTILKSGNIGIGTNSPNNLLELSSATSGGSLRFSSSANTAFYWDIGRDSVSTGDFLFRKASGGAASDMMRITNDGNVGIGVTPSAWGTSSIKALQVGTFGSLAWTGGVDINMFNNAFYDGTNFKYIASQEAARYLINRNSHTWFIAPAGNAGNNITFTQTMAITSAGNIRHTNSSVDAEYFKSGNITIAASGGTLTYGIRNGSLVYIVENNTGTGGLFFATYASGTITLIADPSGFFATSDTANRICFYKSANNPNATIKNNRTNTNFTLYQFAVSD